jgi:hypothetical protein
MKEKIKDFPEEGDEVEEDIEMLRNARRGTKTISDYFHSPALGFAYTPSDIQTVMEERNIVLGRKGVADQMKEAHPWRIGQLFAGGGGSKPGPKVAGKMPHRSSFGAGIDFFDEDSEDEGEEEEEEEEAGGGGGKGKGKGKGKGEGEGEAGEKDITVEIDPRLVTQASSGGRSDRTGSEASDSESSRWSMGF